MSEKEDEAPQRYPIPLWSYVKGSGFEGRVIDRPGPYSLRIRLEDLNEQIIAVSLVQDCQPPSPELERIMSEMEKKRLIAGRMPPLSND